MIIYNKTWKWSNRFKDISVRAGMTEAEPNKDTNIIEENEVCENFTRPDGAPADTKEIHFNCSEVKNVTVITVQIMNNENESILHFDEIEFIEQSKFIAIWMK